MSIGALIPRLAAVADGNFLVFSHQQRHWHLERIFALTKLALN
jgi:hypothetical protein